MRTSIKSVVLAGFCLMLIHYRLAAQDSSSLYEKVLQFPDKVAREVSDKTEAISGKVVKQTQKYLSKLARQERKLQARLGKKDSLAAMRIFGDVQQQYTALQAGMSGVAQKADKLHHTYMAHLDSMQTALKFLSQKEEYLKDAAQMRSRITSALEKTAQLQDRFAKAEEIQGFINQRRQFLQEQLGKYNLKKQLKAFGKQAYYYQAQVAEYKSLLDNPSKIEEKVLGLLKETAAFKSFFARNSQLASLFRMPSGDGPAAGDVSGISSLAGLQTRASVQQVLQQRLGLDKNMQQMVSERLRDAQSQLAERKKKVMETLGEVGGGEVAIPDFKPNNQKTKSFLQRLELGANLQTVKANRFFPSTTDVGLSVGYKLNDKSIVGVGGSYKMGLGRDVRHVSVSHQGAGARSYVDYKLKGGFWMSGGWEMNYRSEFRSVDVLKDYSVWQKSALLGVSKKYQIGSKTKGNTQLLYDLLWKQQTPRTQPLIFRLGYTLK